MNPNKIAAPVSGRNYGVDLLKIVSMFMVVVLHVLGVGGVLNGSAALSLNYEISWLLETGAYCAVNCFALASGFVMVNAVFKYHRIFVLWLQVVFHSLLIITLFSIFMPYAEGVEGGFIKAFQPLSLNRYWYFTAYFAMFFFIPFFNHLLQTLSRKSMLRLIITLVIIFSIIPTLFNKDTFLTQNGYSVLWLSALYLMGGYCKKYSVAEKFQSWKALLIYTMAVLATWGSRFLFRALNPSLPEGLRNESLLVNYTSPTILLAAFGLLVLFANMSLKNNFIKWLIRFLAPLSFSVYIIHTNPLVWNNILKGSFTSYADGSVIKLVGFVLIAAAAIYLICSLIDWVRLLLFRLFKVDWICKGLTDKVYMLFSKLFRIDKLS